MVEVMRLYSNPSWQRFRFRLEKQLAEAATRLRPDSVKLARIPQRVERRLGTAALERIVAEYVAGASTTVLARQHRIGKGTLLRLLDEHGVTLRRRGRSAI